ncbi:MAG: hypothetical protein H6667_03835 [Ardenticatenaceae bacterium]|nr:hypothetical protein [Ardenticatenaceae bacterium]
MNRKLSFSIMVSLLMGVSLGILLGPALGSVISFLVKIVCAIFFDNALGNIALGMVIGAVSALIVYWLAMAVSLRRNVDKLDERPSTWGAL